MHEKRVRARRPRFCTRWWACVAPGGKKWGTACHEQPGSWADDPRSCFFRAQLPARKQRAAAIVYRLPANCGKVIARTWRAGELDMPRPMTTSPGVPLFHPFFVGMGGALLIAAAFTDAMYVSNSLMQWANFSAWLIAAGLVLALLATIMLLIDGLFGRAGRIRLPDLVLLRSCRCSMSSYTHAMHGHRSCHPGSSCRGWPQSCC